MEKEMTKEEIDKLYFKNGHKKVTNIEISIEKPNIFQKIFNIKTKNYQVKSLVLNELLKISELAVDLPVINEEFFEDLDNNGFYDFIKNYGNKLITILSIVLKEKEKFIAKNLNPKEMTDIFIKITELSNIEHFFLSTSLIKTQMNLKNEETEK